jgi:hypothetical protein
MREQTREAPHGLRIAGSNSDHRVRREVALALQGNGLPTSGDDNTSQGS